MLNPKGRQKLVLTTYVVEAVHEVKRKAAINTSVAEFVPGYGQESDDPCAWIQHGGS